MNIASGEGFSYSGSLSSKATLKWTAGNLDRWLKSPQDFAPGNTMAFAGIPSAKDRGDLVAFLMGWIFTSGIFMQNRQIILGK